MKKSTKLPLETYWDVLDKGYDTPCFIWRTSLNKKTGYGYYWHSGKTHAAHVFVFKWFGGVIPPKMKIDHLCRNRACVNPRHIEVVTNTENARRGINTKLTISIVLNIKTKLANNITSREIARQLNIKESQVADIKNKRSWRDV